MFCIMNRAANDPSVVTITEKAPSRVIVKTDGTFTAQIMKKTYLAVTSTLQNTRRVVVHL